MTTPTDDVRGHGEDGLREDFLAQLRRVNTDRYHAWVGDGQDAGILFDASELGGEVGELLNVVKKLVREEAGWRGSRAAPEDFADECADVLICLDKLARRRGVDLAAATITKFNATSDKQGFPHKLSATPIQPERGMVEALREAMVLIDELNERVESRKFYGIGQALHGKLCTVRATLQRAALSSLDSKGEGR